uniref:proline-rich protein 2-like n=1 Tax=Odobenus rosmarus divergens TaxID=9708 RepID=UPI00063C5DCC|nr:PREDICTED: proline-rich protein 2-like [Odobenus rosmarus divergens]
MATSRMCSSSQRIWRLDHNPVPPPPGRITGSLRAPPRPSLHSEAPEPAAQRGLIPPAAPLAASPSGGPDPGGCSLAPVQCHWGHPGDRCPGPGAGSPPRSQQLF